MAGLKFPRALAPSALALALAGGPAIAQSIPAGQTDATDAPGVQAGLGDADLSGAVTGTRTATDGALEAIDYGVKDVAVTEAFNAGDLALERNGYAGGLAGVGVDRAGIANQVDLSAAARGMQHLNSALSTVSGLTGN